MMSKQFVTLIAKCCDNTQWCQSVVGGEQKSKLIAREKRTETVVLSMMSVVVLIWRGICSCEDVKRLKILQEIGFVFLFGKRFSY